LITRLTVRGRNTGLYQNPARVWIQIRIGIEFIWM